jgi:hypothetical protein
MQEQKSLIPIMFSFSITKAGYEKVSPTLRNYKYEIFWNKLFH